MHRSGSFKRVNKITRTGRNVIHYRRQPPSGPRCAICKAELNGITMGRSGGRTRRTNSRMFGGVLCANCTADVVKLGSRVEQGDMKLGDIGIRQRAYVLQLMSH
jgi:ribosomal protein L34E